MIQGQPLVDVGQYSVTNALATLLTVESLLFASLSLATNLSAPSSFGARAWFFGLKSKHIAAISVASLAFVAAGAGFAWKRIFLDSGFPLDSAGRVIALALAFAIVIQPILAALLAMGLRKRS